MESCLVNKCWDLQTTSGVRTKCLYNVLISVEGIETSILREYLDNCVQFDGAPSESGFVINFEIKSLVPPGYIVDTSIGLMHLKGCQ